MPEEIVAEIQRVDALASQGQPIPDTERAIGVTEVTHDHCGSNMGAGRMIRSACSRTLRLRMLAFDAPSRLCIKQPIMIG